MGLDVLPSSLRKGAPFTRKPKPMNEAKLPAQRYHIACYKEKTGRDAKSVTAKWPFTCAYCGKRCSVGEAMTWTRRFSSSEEEQPRPQLTTVTLGELAKAQEEEGDHDMGNNAAEAVNIAIGLDVGKLADAMIPYLEERFTPKKSAEGEVSVNVYRVQLEPGKETPEVDAGAQHKSFPLLLKACSRKRVNVWLAGPSGSGKTTAAEQVAKVLSQPYRYTGSVSDPYALIGYKDANGNYVRTMFRETYENGGVFLWDEVDGSDPRALVAFNAALSGSCAAFPDGMVKRHPDCIIIAAANTWGHGGTHEYVGRMKQDQAFLKRFAFIAWDYDENLELATAPNPTWTKRVQAVRKRVREKGLRVMVTPRESYIGAELLEAGIPQDEVENMTIRSGMTAEQWEQVKK